jgi:hypothetical protein
MDSKAYGCPGGGVFGTGAKATFREHDFATPVEECVLFWGDFRTLYLESLVKGTSPSNGVLLQADPTRRILTQQSVEDGC